MRLNKCFKSLCAGIILSLITAWLLDHYYPPDLSRLNDSAMVVKSTDGRLLRAFTSETGVWRYPIKIDQVSADYLDALLAYEDRYFYQHPGVNPFALLRATWQAIRYQKVVSGGSTLTMQVARLLYPHEKSITGKLYQITRALQLEWHYSKTEILEIYLNIAPFGGIIEGVQAASLTYFDKNANELLPTEAALLAVLPQSPSRYRPDLHPQSALKARNKILKRLLKLNRWPKTEVQEYLKTPLYADYYAPPQIAPILSRRLKNKSRSPIIQTFIDAGLQQRVAYLVKQQTASVSHYASGAAMVMHASSGKVLAYVGSADFFNTQISGQVDMIQAIRSPGSTLKPFIYGSGIEHGLVHEMSLLQDIPVIKNAYRVENFAEGYSGPVSLKAALLKSLNIPLLQLFNHMELTELHARLHNAGLNFVLPQGAKVNKAVALGGFGTDLESLVTLYSAFLNQGIATQPRYKKDSPLQQGFVLQAGPAWIIQNILRQQAVNPFAPPSKLGTPASSPIGWKTGTSYDQRDAWTLGFSGEYIIGVWIGRADGIPLYQNTGAQSALPLFLQIARQLESDFKPQKPKEVSFAKICWPLGLSQTLTSKTNCQIAFDSWLFEKRTPPTFSGYDKSINESLSNHYWLEADGSRALKSCASASAQLHKIALFPYALEPYLPAQYQRKHLLPKYSENCNEQNYLDSKLKITSLSPNTQLMRRFPDEPITIPLTVNLKSQPIYWLINQVPHQGDSVTLQHAGDYKITALTQDGNSDSIVVTVPD